VKGIVSQEEGKANMQPLVAEKKKKHPKQRGFSCWVTLRLGRSPAAVRRGKDDGGRWGGSKLKKKQPSQKTPPTTT